MAAPTREEYVYRRKIADLQAAIEDPVLRDDAHDLIRALIDQVVLMPLEGRLEIEIKGELAGILQLCDGARKAKPGTVFGAGPAKQLKMVAGTGINLYRNRCYRYTSGFLPISDYL